MTGFRLFALIAMMVASPLAAQEAPPTLTVQGQAQVAASPDMATITIGAETQAKTAQEALRQTSDATTQVLAVLRAAGVADADLQTRDLSLNPVWDNRRYEDNRPPKVVGFNASNMVQARVRDLDKVGDILDAVVSNGATSFRGLQFGLQDPQPVADLAREDAVADARRKAQLYAQAAGLNLGPILSISEMSQGAVPVQMRMAAEAAMAVPVAAGEVSTSAQVTIVYALRP